MIKIIQGDCLEKMGELQDNSINLIITSPPYNTGRNSGKMDNHEVRYDIYLEQRSNQEYIEWTRSIFTEFDRILSKNGAILYNMSYGNENPTIMYEVIADLISNTPFTVADTIVWKKASALPNNVSHNKLTRITENVFVICRKTEYKTFHANKKVKSHSRTGQKYYENVFNFIEARNNDGSNPLNKATYSTDLVNQMLDIYAQPNSVILDPFGGTGTTALACGQRGFDCISIELSEAQCEYAKERLGLWA